MSTMSARRAFIGDRMLVTVKTSRRDDAGEHVGEVVTRVVTIDTVARQGCGCDKASFDRPDSVGGPCPRVDIYPVSCHHDDPVVSGAVDFDEARVAAQVASAA